MKKIILFIFLFILCSSVYADTRYAINKFSNMMRFTPEGGIAYLHTAGEVISKGMLVDVNSSGKVIKIVKDSPDPIGAAYTSCVTNESVWIVYQGVADCLFTAGGSTAGMLARGFVAAESGFITGYVTAEPIPVNPFSDAKHFFEIGHVLQSRTGTGLAKVQLHFN